MFVLRMNFPYTFEKSHTKIPVKNSRKHKQDHIKAFKSEQKVVKICKIEVHKMRRPVKKHESKFVSIVTRII